MSLHPRFGLLGVLIVVPVVVPAASTGAQPANLVQNGLFEEDADGDGVPDDWATSGRGDIEQKLTLDAGHDDGTAAKLECTKFVPGTPDSHAMVCQVGEIGVERGQWYRLTFWAKGRDMPRPLCQVALSNTRPWGPSGVHAYFPVSPSWQRIERICQATEDVPGETSRLQFWFSCTGTLWLDDVVLEPIDMRVEHHPQISTKGVRNLVPNSSFECGAAGWGSYAPDLQTWTGNAFRLIGEIDESTAYHGQRSLRIHLAADEAPTYYFDYFDPIEQPLMTVVAAHVGWVPLSLGEACVLSCFLKADKPDVPAVLMMHQSNGAEPRQSVRVGTKWERFRATFTPSGDFGWAAIGLDLQDSDLDAATLWVDGVQLEFGQDPSDYSPRAELESSIETPVAGNVFADPEAGLTLDLCAHNNADTARPLRGRLVVTDFFDKEVMTRSVERQTEAGASIRVSFENLLSDRRGFYRVHWRPDGHTAAFPQTLRCALIDPYEHSDSAFGMNHAFGWDFLLRLCREAGMTWMRDWSVKWHTVEPEQGALDFTKTDPQIDRVLAERLNALMLFPFPSATWSSEADVEVIREVVGDRGSEQPRYAVAWRAKDDALFRNYVARSVAHYQDRTQYYEIMNEPLYTTYAVPARFGYEMEDYLDLLRTAYEAVKEHQPDAQVLGGIGTWVEGSWVREFIEAGGLRWCDIMDIHLYPVTIPPELYEDDLAETWRMMQDRGEARPIWLTEFGCYADDDPYKTPGHIGDTAMSRANWSSEREASEALVKSSAVFLTHGVRKVFFHSGTCGPINDRNGASIFFEYAGAPRKMYAALSALANVLGPDFEPLAPRVATDHLRAHLFRTQLGVVAVVWASGDSPVSVDLPTGVTARDMMGNPVEGDTVEITSTPTYLVCGKASRLRHALEGAK
jgi:hypothetical protein